MKIEFLIIGKEYKQILKKYKPDPKFKVYQPRKKKVGDYILDISCKLEEETIVKELSDCVEKLIQKFNEEKVKYYILTDDISGFYLKKLFPFAHEFETKLRKFITWSLIDITETVSFPINDYFSNIKDFDVSKNSFNATNFLSSWTLETTFRVLFDKPSLLGEATKIITKNNKENNNISKKDLLKLISSITEKSIWEEFFEDKYKNCSLLNTYKKICTARNEVMHFHKIDYKKYESLTNIFNEGIKEINSLLENTVQIEVNDDNISKLVSHTEYIVNMLISFGQIISKITIPSESLINALSQSLSSLKLTPIEGVLTQSKILNELSNNLSNVNLLPIFDGLKGITDYNKKMNEYLNSIYKETDEADDINEHVSVENDDDK